MYNILDILNSGWGLREEGQRKFVNKFDMPVRIFALGLLDTVFDIGLQ